MMHVHHNFRLKIMHMLWAIDAVFSALRCGSRARDAKLRAGLRLVARPVGEWAWPFVL